MSTGDTPRSPRRRRVLPVKPFPRERQQQQQQQQGGVHVFRTPHRLRCSTPTPPAGEEWVRQNGIGCWQRTCSAAARAGTGLRGRVMREVGRMHPLPLQQQRQRRSRERPAYRVLGMLLLFLFACWSSSGPANGRSATILVLGDSVSVGFGGGCPGACSGHGYCTNPSTETCTCHQGWAGGDCSIRELIHPRLC